MGEHRISLFGNPNARKFARQVGEVGHFDTGDVVEISGIVAIAADAIGQLPDPVRNIRYRLMKTLPLAGNAGAAVLMRATFTDVGDEKWFAGLKTRSLKIVGDG